MSGITVDSLVTPLAPIDHASLTLFVHELRAHQENAPLVCRELKKKLLASKNEALGAIEVLEFAVQSGVDGVHATLATEVLDTLTTLAKPRKSAEVAPEVTQRCTAFVLFLAEQFKWVPTFGEKYENAKKFILDKISMYVLFEGKAIRVALDRSSAHQLDVRTLKSYVAKMINVPADSQVMSMNGRTLSDTETGKDMNLIDSTEITVTSKTGSTGLTPPMTPSGGSAAGSGTSPSSGLQQKLSAAGKALASKEVLTVQSATDGKKYNFVFNANGLSLVNARVLKTHLKGKTGIPESEQVLSVDGREFLDHMSGKDMGLNSTSIVMLSTKQPEPESQPSTPSGVENSTSTQPEAPQQPQQPESSSQQEQQNCAQVVKSENVASADSCDSSSIPAQTENLFQNQQEEERAIVAENSLSALATALQQERENESEIEEKQIETPKQQQESPPPSTPQPQHQESDKEQLSPQQELPKIDTNLALPSPTSTTSTRSDAEARGSVVSPPVSPTSSKAQVTVVSVVTGKSFRLKFDASDLPFAPVSLLKEFVSKPANMRPADQAMFCNGRYLEDSMSGRDFGLSDGCEIILSPKKRAEMYVTCGEAKYTLTAPAIEYPALSLSTVKAMLQSVSGVPPQEQDLFYSTTNRSLPSDGTTPLNLVPGATLALKILPKQKEQSLSSERESNSSLGVGEPVPLPLVRPDLGSIAVELSNATALAVDSVRKDADLDRSSKGVQQAPSFVGRDAIAKLQEVIAQQRQAGGSLLLSKPQQISTSQISAQNNIENKDELLSVLKSDPLAVNDANEAFGGDMTQIGGLSLAVDRLRAKFTTLPTKPSQHQALSTDVMALQEENAKLRERLAKSVDDTVVQRLKDMVSDMKERHRKELVERADTIRKMYAAEMQELRDAHEQTILQMQEEMQELRDVHEQTILQMQHTHAEELEQAKNEAKEKSGQVTNQSSTILQLMKQGTLMRMQNEESKKEIAKLRESVVKLESKLKRYEEDTSRVDAIAEQLAEAMKAFRSHREEESAPAPAPAPLSPQPIVDAQEPVQPPTTTTTQAAQVATPSATQVDEIKISTTASQPPQEEKVEEIPEPENPEIPAAVPVPAPEIPETPTTATNEAQVVAEQKEEEKEGQKEGETAVVIVDATINSLAGSALALATNTDEVDATTTGQQQQQESS